MIRAIFKCFLLMSVCSPFLECSQRKDDRSDAILSKLGDNEASIVISIGGKAFYPKESIFKGQLLFSDQMLSLTLTDQFEGKTMLNIGGEKWYAQKPVTRIINPENPYAGSLKLGKLIDAANLIGEGYMMTEGQIEALSLSKNELVFEIKGKVGKYSDFNQPDKYLPIDGLIVYKKPVFSIANVSEQDIFSPTQVR